MGEIERLKKRNEQLDQRVAALEDRVDTQKQSATVSRRTALGVGAAGLGLGGLATSNASAATNQVGTIGSQSDRVDVFAEDLDVSGDSNIGGGPLSFTFVDSITDDIQSGSSVTLDISNTDFTRYRLVFSFKGNSNGDLIKLRFNNISSDYHFVQRNGSSLSGRSNLGSLHLMEQQGGLAVSAIWDITNTGSNYFPSIHGNGSVQEDFNRKVLIGGSLGSRVSRINTVQIIAGSTLVDLDASPEFNISIYGANF